jgi:hypothetical protein
MQVVLITPPTTAPNEVHDVNRMFDAGLPVLHLRKPVADTVALRRYLQDINPQYLNRVVVHQHHSIAKEFNLKVTTLSKPWAAPSSGGKHCCCNGASTCCQAGTA